MYELFRGAALVAATVTAGLMAGLFYAFSISVMTGLGRVDDRTFVTAMQRINVAILNGWFALIFGGALVLTAVATVLHIRGDGRSLLPWVGAALVRLPRVGVGPARTDHRLAAAAAGRTKRIRSVQPVFLVTGKR